MTAESTTMRQLGVLSTRQRSGRAQVRRDLRSGRLSLASVLRNPPRELADDLVFDVLLRSRGFGLTKLRKANARAMSAGVNFALPLGTSSERSRRWLVESVLGEEWASGA